MASSKIVLPIWYDVALLFNLPKNSSVHPNFGPNLSVGGETEIQKGQRFQQTNNPLQIQHLNTTTVAATLYFRNK